MSAEVKSDNELIEEFYISQGGKPHVPADLCFYESDWNMLMPVVEKINSIDKTEVSIYPSHCIISVDGTAQAGAHDFTVGNLFKIVRLSVVNYIKWYNSQPK